jgi:hypothetical protein
MTDTLPRPIPQDPAEQERLMPEWVKVEVCRLWNMRSNLMWVSADLAPEWGIFRHALTIWQWMPEPVDPDEAIADDIIRRTFQSSNAVGRGKSMLMEMAKRVRAMERGEG